MNQVGNLVWPSASSRVLIISPLTQMLEETSQEEIDDLADQLQEAQDRIKELVEQVAALKRQPGGR